LDDLKNTPSFVTYQFCFDRALETVKLLAELTKGKVLFGVGEEKSDTVSFITENLKLPEAKNSLQTSRKEELTLKI